jgi:hypothetical protein
LRTWAATGLVWRHSCEPRRNLTLGRLGRQPNLQYLEIEMLTWFRRHVSRYRTDPAATTLSAHPRRGKPDGEMIRRSLELTSWEGATEKIRT